MLPGVGCLETITDEKGSRAACPIGVDILNNATPKNLCVRHLLARGPAFRARSSLWSMEIELQRLIQVSRENRGMDQGMKKKLPLDLGVFCLRCPNRRTDTIKILARQGCMIIQVCSDVDS